MLPRNNLYKNILKVVRRRIKDMRTELEDLVVIKKPEGRGNLIIKVDTLVAGIITGFNALEKPSLEADSFEFDEACILANFGKSLPEGMDTVFGVRRPKELVSKVNIKGATLNNFTKISEDALTFLATATEAAFKTLRDSGFLPKGRLPFEVNIYPKKGKKEGHFNGHELAMFVSEDSAQNPDLLAWLVNHEVGHYLWPKVPAKLKAQVIKSFHESVKIQEREVAYLHEIRERAILDKDIDSWYNGLPNGKEAEDFDKIWEHIEYNHCLRWKDVVELTKDGDDLSAFWPTSSILISNQEVIVTAYANTNPEEFWCEAFSAYMTEQLELPKKIYKLVAGIASTLT